MRHATSNLLAIAVAGALLAGCASTPRRSPEVARARNAVETLSSQPQAEEVAGPDLKAAREDLHSADSALRKGSDMKDVNQLAYLALRHAQAGQARVEAARSQAEVAHAAQERDRLLLESKKRQAMIAQQQAQSAHEQLRAAKSQVQQARAQAQSAQQQLASERQQLKELQKQQIGAHQTGQGMVVTLSNVLFSTGKSVLQPGAHLQLERLASYLKDHPKQRVLIEGNTDNTGSAAFNQKLSAARAQAVAQALELRGVPAKQFKTIGLGEAYPVASNSTAAGRQQNRRVDVVFSNESGQFSEAALSRQNAIRR